MSEHDDMIDQHRFEEERRLRGDVAEDEDETDAARGLIVKAGLLISALLSDGRADDIPNSVLDECEAWSIRAQEFEAARVSRSTDSEPPSPPPSKESR